MEIHEVDLDENVLKRIMEIDDSIYVNSITLFKWYTDRYNKNHKAIVLLDENVIVGYVIIANIKKELYDAIINGVLIDGVGINSQMFINQSEYKYLASFVIIKEYRNLGYAQKIVEHINKKKGKFCAISVSDDGYNILKTFMNYDKSLENNVSVFRKIIK